MVSQTSTCFMCLLQKSFENTVGKGEIAPTLRENFPPFSSNSKLSTANSFSIERFKTSFWKGSRLECISLCCHQENVHAYYIVLHYARNDKTKQKKKKPLNTNDSIYYRVIQNTRYCFEVE